MSVSREYPALPNLYCNEAAGDLITSTADLSSSDSLIDDEDEDFITRMFDSEPDEMQLGSKSVSRFCNLREVLVTARQEAIKWMLKVHAYYRFRPETAYLSVNYLDRFLCTRTWPQGEVWPLQLLSVACLALAAKMEETSVPLLLDLQIIEPRFLFKPKTVQRMELLVMSSLKWRLRTITPFHFLNYFIAKLSCSISSQHNGFSCVSSLASDLFIRTCTVIDFLDYSPSTIAAAVVLWVTNQAVDDQKLGCLHNKLNIEVVKRCYNLVKRKMSQLPLNKQQKLEPLPADQIGYGSCNAGKTRNEETMKSSQDMLPSKC